MTEGFDLKNFLDEARQDGTTDSEGHFTVSHDKALTKLAHFALPNPYDWVLKILQAVNQWRCSRLIVQQSREATSFYFCPPESNFPPDGAFVQSLKSGSFDRSGPVDTLCLALRALVDQVKLSFVFASCRDGVMGEPVYAGDDVSKFGEERRLEWSRLDKEGFRLTVSHFTGKESVTGRYLPTFFAQRRRDVSIAKLLVSASYSSQTEVFLDGLRVSDICLHPKLGSHSVFRPCTFGLLGQDHSGKPQVVLHPLDPKLARSNLSQPEMGAFSNSSFYLRTGSWLNIHQLQSPVGPVPPAHQIFWVRHGVVVERQVIGNSTLASTLYFFRNADNLRTDLAGLSLGIAEEDHELTALYLELTATELLKLSERLARFLDGSESTEEDQATEPSLTNEDLDLGEAGKSMLSASLGWDLSALDHLGKSLIDTGRRAFLFGRTGSRLREWVVFLEAEVARLARDLRRTPRPIRSSQFLNDGY